MGDRDRGSGGPTGGSAHPAAKPTQPWRIREAHPDDVGAIDALIRELAAFEHASDAVRATPDDLASALFGESPLARALVADVGADVGADVRAPGHPPQVVGSEASTVVGCALWFVTYSTWTGRGGIWLEDLYVTPDHRGRGIASALLAALAAECVRRDLARLDFSVLDWNSGAQRVYRAAGAEPLTEWTTWRVEGPALRDLAARHDGALASAHPGSAPAPRPTSEE